MILKFVYCNKIMNKFFIWHVILSLSNFHLFLFCQEVQQISKLKTLLHNCSFYFLSSGDCYRSLSLYSHILCVFNIHIVFPVWNEIYLLFLLRLSVLWFHNGCGRPKFSISLAKDWWIILDWHWQKKICRMLLIWWSHMGK